MNKVQIYFPITIDILEFTIGGSCRTIKEF